MVSFTQDANITCNDCQGDGVARLSVTLQCAGCGSSGSVLDRPCMCCGGRGKQRVTIKVPCATCEVRQSVDWHLSHR